MPSRLSPVWSAARYCGDVLLTLGCWALWIALGVLLAVQVAVTANREIQVPRFVLRSLEERFAASNVQARFGRALLDPTGRVLLQDVRLSLPEFAEPVALVRAVYVELDPWPLLLGRVEARRVRATGATLFIPAMVSPSGRTEEGVSNVDFDVVTRGTQVEVRSLTAHVAGVGIVARGDLHLPRIESAGRVSPLPLIANLAPRYVPLTRELSRLTQRLRVLESPQLGVELTPADGRIALARLTLLADSVTLPQARDLHGGDLRIETRLPVGGDLAVNVPFRGSMRELQAGGIAAQQVEVSGVGQVSTQRLFVEPRELAVSIGSAASRGVSLRHIAGRFATSNFPRLEGSVVAEYEGEPLGFSGEADLSAGTAAFQVRGRISPAILTPIGAALRRDVRKFVDFGAPVAADLEARFGSGWTFTSVSGRVFAEQIRAYRVPMDAAGGEIAFDGRHFHARHAFAIQGANIARGSFDQDLGTREFRFLLNGRLRPLDISGWFHDWWTNFFEHFEFPDEPPDASVDVAGRWTASHETTVFLFAQSGRPAIRGAKLDYARTLMFLRPNFFDALEVHGTRGAGELRGAFSLTRDPDQRLEESSEVVFNLDSTLDLGTGATLLGPAVVAAVAPFHFERPPQLQASGRVRLGESGAEEPGRSIHLVARSSGHFSAYGLPAESLAFDARLSDEELVLDQVEARIAGGSISGRARIWGPAADRRVGFDAYLRDAVLGEAITVASDYVARRGGRPAPDKILTGENRTRVDLAVSAEGSISDPYSFRGSGNASLSGEQLGQVRLLGLLSELLDFTALRFTAARAEFKIEGRKLVFPTVNVTGANSAIHAHGDYALDRHQLDFNARVYPFEESHSFLQSIMGAVLTPFSAVLEVRLTGPLEQPTWAFVIGPTNLLNSLSQPSVAAPPATPAPAPALKPGLRSPMKTD